MKQKTDSATPISASALIPETLSETLSKNRKYYLSYNISRLRELIRYLSPEKLDLFNTIPLMLHLNYPDFPGYVKEAIPIHGIINFQGSGFYTQAMAINHLNESLIQPYTTDSPMILSLFHIGSAGTLTQSEKSDFDYWVIVDKKGVDDQRLALLQTKLSQIETYCYERFRQEVTFFVHDAEHIRNNDFATVDASSYGLAPRTVLKEEFYRTFIMIAGKIPYWAVLPSNLSDLEYGVHIDRIIATPSLNAIENDYVDLGNLYKIDIRECLGVILWQILKAKDDPVKSLIKASLIANYYFFQGKDNPLLCNSIKTHFHEALLDNYHLDPYAMVFETIVRFYRDMMDSSGGELIKTCIFLRLCGFPLVSLPDEDSPKRFLLKRYLKEWRLDKETVSRLLSYKTWPEIDKLAFDDKVFKKLSFLYELILRNQDENLVGIEMSAFDLAILKNRTAVFLTKKPGKLERCSTWLQKMSAQLNFLVIKSQGNDFGWRIYSCGRTLHSSPNKLLYQEADFLKAAGWMLANHLYSKSGENVHFQSDQAVFSQEKTKAGFVELITFMDKEAALDEPVFSDDPSWRSLFMVLKEEGGNAEKAPSGLDLLLKNTWGEYYFDTVDVSYIVNENEKCYKIASVIWAYRAKTPHFSLKYKLIAMGHRDLSGMVKTVSEIIEKYVEAEMNKMGSGKKTIVDSSVETPNSVESRLYLDEI